MYLLKKTIFIALLILCQTVIFPRLNFFGVIPDLFLIAAVVFSVLEEEKSAMITATIIGFVQDIFSEKIYFNTVFKGIASAIINFIKADFKGDDYSFSAMMLIIYSAGWVAVQHIFLFYFLGKQVSIFNFIFIFCAQTGYNLILLPVIFSIITRMKNG
ncbi:MAG: rod shape-determining protein MreD [Candidatus Margulisiibacteriota bacterium]